MTYLSPQEPKGWDKDLGRGRIGIYTDAKSISNMLTDTEKVMESDGMLD